MLGYFKYFNFLGELFTMAAGGEWLKMNIFLPVGISFFTFQSISYVIDVYRGRIQPLGRWIDYVFYVSFFPQLVAGPIVRARDFIPQMYKNPTVTRSEFVPYLMWSFQENGYLGLYQYEFRGSYF